LLDFLTISIGADFEEDGTSTVFFKIETSSLSDETSEGSLIEFDAGF